MAFGLKKAGADLAYKGGLLNGNRYIALFSAEGTELTAAGYSRILMTLADWQSDGAVYENRAQEIFGPPGAVWPAIVGWGLYDALTSGNLLFDVDAPDTDPPALNALVAAAAEAIGWSFTGVTSAGSLKAMNEGLLSGTRYLSLHAGSSAVQANSADGRGSQDGNAINTDGTSGAAAGKTMLTVSIAASQWTLDDASVTNRRARNNVVRGFGIQTANLPDPMSYAFRDGNAHNSNILASATLTSEDPDVGDALSFDANAIAFHCTLAAAA